MVERPPRVREVTRSIPGRIIPTTLKIVEMVAFLDAQGCMCWLADWCQDKLASSTGNLPSKRRDKTEILLKAV